MLYSIIPPILVVVSLIGIILFLVKKAPQVARLEEEKKDRKSDILSNATGDFLGIKNGEKEGKKISHRMLFIGEKIMLRMKLVFLKMENRMTGWGESMREKRKARDEFRKKSVLEKKDEGDNWSGVGTNDDSLRKDNQCTDFDEVEKIQPLLNEKILMPQNKEEKKDLFEKILIERIAANPKDIEAYERLGEYYMEVENWNYAKECFKQVMKLNPKNRNVKMKMRKLERLLQK